MTQIRAGVFFCMLVLMSVLGVFARLRKATIRFVMSIRPSVHLSSTWNNSASTGKIFMKFGISLFVENSRLKFKFH